MTSRPAPDPRQLPPEEVARLLAIGNARQRALHEGDAVLVYRVYPDRPPDLAIPEGMSEAEAKLELLKSVLGYVLSG